MTNHQRRLLQVLARGGKYSAADLVMYTHFSDPRSHIKRLRDKGVNILDEWRKCADGIGQYKVYFLGAASAADAPQQSTNK